MSSKKRNEASAPVSGTLNTVWHGTFAFVIRPEGVEVLVPQIGMHAYYTGTWGPGLIELAPAKRFRLMGLKKADRAAEFRPEENVYLSGPLSERYERLLRCSWEPMLPNRIWTLRQQKVDFAKPIPAGVRVSDRIGTVQVLSFDFEDLNDLSVLEMPAKPGGPQAAERRLPWRPVAVPAGGAGSKPHQVVNLHIFADPPRPFTGRMASMNYEHPVTAFTELLQLTNVPELRLQLRQDGPPALLPDVRMPEGLTESQLESLAESGLLDGSTASNVRDLSTASAAVIAGAGGWRSLSERTAQSANRERRSSDSRRAFLGHLGLGAVGGIALSRVAFGFNRPPYNCGNIIICPGCPGFAAS